MAATPSNMMPLGAQAPSFKLPDTISGKIISLDEITPEKALVIMFICNHCPYVLHIIDKFAEIGRTYQEKGVKFVAISSNDVVQYPQDGPEKMKDFAKAHGFTFPYLFDESQDVAKIYMAACTPDLYVFNASLECVYRGQFDESRPKNDIPVSGNHLLNALDATIAGEKVDPDQKPSLGCNIKWK